MDVQRVLAAIGEPTRFRILTLLAAGPLTVGEVAQALGALQPQTTKHLQLLESAGVIRIRKVGRRRLAGIDRDAMRLLARWADGVAVATRDDDDLDRYAEAVRTAGMGADVQLERTLAAPPAAVWAAWTSEHEAARWWAPRHFEVVRCRIRPEPGSPVELVLREGDGSEYASAGAVRIAEEGRRLTFELSPVDGHGRPFFHVVVDARLQPTERGTLLRMQVTASGADAAAAPMLAGLEPGWTQQLDRLEELLSPAIGADEAGKG